MNLEELAEKCRAKLDDVNQTTTPDIRRGVILSALEEAVAEKESQVDRVNNNAVGLFANTCDKHDKIIKGMSFSDFITVYPQECIFCFKEKLTERDAALAEARGMIVRMLQFAVDRKERTLVKSEGDRIYTPIIRELRAFIAQHKAVKGEANATTGNSSTEGN